MRNNLIFALMMLISQFSLAQWPVNSGSQGTIIGTVGEHRNTARIHNGTDCISTLSVCSIIDDKIKRISTNFDANNSANYILMESGILYRHVNILPTIARNRVEVNAINNGLVIVPLTQRQNFAIMVIGGQLPTHVHVENGTDQNYLSSNGFGAPGFNFIDNVLPQFGPNANSEGVSVYKDLKAGNAASKFTQFVTDEGLPVDQRPLIIYGPIDIVANAYQKRINNFGNAGIQNFLAPHSLGYNLVNLINPNQPVFEDFNRLNFDYGFGGSSTTPQSTIVRNIIHASNSTATNPFFTVTNQFLNGIATEGNIKTELLKDGDYEIKVRAEGIQGTTTGPLVTEKIKKVRIDNYKTYIRKVRVVDQNGLEKYSAEWSELTRPGDGSIVLTVRNNEPFKSGATVTMSVTTSEKVPLLSLNLPTGPNVSMTAVGSDGIEWQASFTLPSSNARTVPLRFTSNNHLFGFVLNQNTADIKRNATTGNFSDQNSVDRSHELKVCPSDNSLTLDVSVVNGQDVTLSATGGTGPYEYSIDEMPIAPNHVSIFSSTSTFTIQFDKDYLFKVRDAGRCQAEKYYTLPKIECNALTQPGGQGTETYQVNLGTIPGTVNISYEMYSIPDEIRVTYRGSTWSSGSVSGSGVYPLTHTPIAGQSNIVTITMVAPLSGTAWVFSVNCPNAAKPVIGNFTSSQEYKIEYNNGIISIIPNSKDRYAVYDLLYKRIGNKDWNVIHNVTLPYQLKSTEELQVKLQQSTVPFESKAKLTVTPNPCTGPVSIEYVSIKSGNINLSIYSLDGRILYTQRISVVKGLNIFKWDPGSKTKGLALIKILQDSTSVNTKILIN